MGVHMYNVWPRLKIVQNAEWCIACDMKNSKTVMQCSGAWGMYFKHVLALLLLNFGFKIKSQAKWAKQIEEAERLRHTQIKVRVS